MRSILIISYALMFIGALNWGLVGLFSFDLVAFLLGEMSAASRLVYALVGISAVINLAMIYSGQMSQEGKSCISCS